MFLCAEVVWFSKTVMRFFIVLMESRRMTQVEPA